MCRNNDDRRHDGFFGGTLLGCLAGIAASFLFAEPVLIPLFLFLGMLAGAVIDVVKRRGKQGNR